MRDSAAGMEAHPFAQFASKQIAIINGSSVSFQTVEEKFNALVAEWRRLRETGSSTDNLVNDAYGQIVAMRWPVVPLLLREVEAQSGHWFTALKWITGLTLVTPDMRGNVRAMRDVWLRWGKECISQTKPQGEVGYARISPIFASTGAISPAGQHMTTTASDLSLAITSGGIQKPPTTTIGRTR
jgi:hypothetical protein